MVWSCIRWRRLDFGWQRIKGKGVELLGSPRDHLGVNPIGYTLESPGVQATFRNLPAGSHESAKLASLVTFPTNLDGPIHCSCQAAARNEFLSSGCQSGGYRSKQQQRKALVRMFRLFHKRSDSSSQRKSILSFFQTSSSTTTTPMNLPCFLRRIQRPVLYVVIFSLSVALLVKNIKFKRFARVNKLAFDETPCTADIPLGPFEGCSSFRITRAVRENLPEDCPWDTNYEIRLLTRTFSTEKADAALTQLCQSAENDLWESTPDLKWKHIDRNLKPDNIASFLHGHTELNTATGNLQNNDGTDPRNNAKYATDQFSFDVARNVRDFYESSASSVRLTDFPLECSAQTVMCCFRRDRQSGDNNGNCQRRNCTAAQPADNTNLCFHDDTAFPGDETIHCHGFTWNKDPSHFSHRLKSNTLFYVTMYDHWYTRGYVESVLPHAAPMCSCVEDMPAVVRADCTEIDMDTDYEVKWDQRRGLQVQPAGPLEYKFQNCQGTPINNDLSSKVKKMKELGDIDDEAVAVVQRHLVGHGDPENQVNEPACETAFEQQRGKVYNTSSSRSVLTFFSVGITTLFAVVLLA